MEHFTVQAIAWVVYNGRYLNSSTRSPMIYISTHCAHCAQFFWSFSSRYRNILTSDHVCILDIFDRLYVRDCAFIWRNAQERTKNILLINTIEIFLLLTAYLFMRDSKQLTPSLNMSNIRWTSQKTIRSAQWQRALNTFVALANTRAQSSKQCRWLQSQFTMFHLFDSCMFLLNQAFKSLPTNYTIWLISRWLIRSTTFSRLPLLINLLTIVRSVPWTHLLGRTLYISIESMSAKTRLNIDAVSSKELEKNIN